MAKLYVGLDVSDRTTSICVVNGRGTVLCEAEAPSTPDDIAAVLVPYKRSIEAVALEAGTLSRWLHDGLTDRGFTTRCLDAAHAHGALRVQRDKTDRNDAFGLAQVVRSGWVKIAHIRSDQATRWRLALIVRAAMVRKGVDIEHMLRQSLKAFGIRLGAGQRSSFEDRLRAALGTDPLMKAMLSGVLRVRAQIIKECAAMQARIAELAQRDDVCQRLMSVPGVGPLTALMFRACIDDPSRFRNSRVVGAYFGLTPRRRQSGQSDWSGSISKRGDKLMRALLCSSAGSLMRVRADSRLKIWAQGLAKRTKPGVARVAVARKICVMMHTIWVTNARFDPGIATPAVVAADG